MTDKPPPPAPETPETPATPAPPAAQAQFPVPGRPVLPFGENIHAMVRHLRIVGALVAMALALLVIVGVALIVLRIVWPVSGSIGAVVTAGVIALAALVVGLVAIEKTSRMARKAGSLAGAAARYRMGCIIAGASNSASACVTLAVLGGGGVSNGLWLPILLATALNVLGLILATPRIKHLRSLHYRPVLPISRV